LWSVCVVLTVKSELNCSEIPTPTVTGWRQLIPLLNSSWLPGNKNIARLIDRYLRHTVSGETVTYWLKP